MGEQARHEARREKSDPGRGHRNAKAWSQAQGTCGTITHLGGPWGRGEEAVGEGRMKKMGRWGGDHRQAQNDLSEMIALVTGGEWALYSTGQGDSNS